MSTRIPSMYIRNRLLTLILSVLVPSFAAAILAVWFVYEEQHLAQEKRIAEASHSLSRLLDNEFRNIEGILGTLAASPTLAEEDFATFYDFAKAIAPPPESTIVLSDTAGTQLLNTRLPFGAALPRGGSNLMALRQRHGPVTPLVSDLFVAPVGKRHDYAVQVPVIKDGGVRYYLSLGQDVSRIQALLDEQKLPASWLGTVVDRNGVIVARSQEGASYVGRQLREDLRQKIVAGTASGIHYGVTLDGRDMAGFFSRAPNSEWTVVISMPQGEMRRLPAYAATLLGSIMLMIMGSAIVAARIYAKNTSEPIEQLRIAADRLGRGEDISPAPSGLIEIDMVSQAMVESSRRIRQHNADLEARVAEAVASAERAQQALLQSQKLEALGRLTAGIAHDFNNILQTLTTALQLLALRPIDTPSRSLIDTCEKALERATILTGQLRAFAKVQDARLETISLNDRLQSAVPLLESALPSSIRLELRIAENLWPVTVDPLQLDLALLNIVINARDAMPDGGRIVIDLRNEHIAPARANLPAGDYVRIAIDDTGTGMPSEVLSQALDPFFTTKPVDKGSGLGLPQAYGFARQAQGMLELRSVQGKGTTVIIHLPRARSAVSPAAPRRTSLTLPPASGTVLFVEDDALIREAVAPALRNAGFAVTVAHDGEEALSLLESGRRFDKVISDIVMPGEISGIRLAKIVQSRFPDTEVILATGYTDMRIDLAGVRLLAKPYELSALVDALATPSEQ